MHIPRQSFLYGLGASLGALALTHRLAADAPAPSNPLQAREGHHPAKAKRVIMLVMEGGPGHMDTFDPKPQLQKLHKTESKLAFGQETGFKFFVGSPFDSRRVGDAGLEMTSPWVHLADPYIADELCNYRGCQAESLNHPEALFHLNTGSRLGGDPGLGAWITYGLGSVNENLPGYVVMTELASPQGGPINWSSGFLPAHFQGTRLRTEGSPLLDLHPMAHKSRAHQRRALDELAVMNRAHAALHVDDSRLLSRVATYELAFRMQAEIPEVIDLHRETAATHSLYGLDDPDTQTFGGQCLMARRLVEHGVRFVQIFSGGWDSHDYLERGHTARIKSVDKPIAGLIRDLKQRGMLDDTLIIWCGEFGRTPDNNKRGGVYSLGRGHNSRAMTVLLAGGGIRRGAIVGATDELGSSAVECVHPLRDLHVTLLHLLGLSDNQLTYFHGGRYKQLSQFGGQIIPELLA